MEEETERTPKEPKDVERALMFAGKHRAEVKWCPEWEHWIVWDHVRWVRDRGGMKVQHLAKEFAASNSAIKNMLQLVKDLVVVHPDDIDAHPYLLNTPGGMIDLAWEPSDDDYDEQGNPNFDEWAYLSRHDPAKLCMKMTGVEWAPQPLHVYDYVTREYIDTPKSRWERFLEEVQPDPEVRNYLQRWAGYMLCGEIREHEMLVLEGEGANGKSVFMDTLLGVMGDYAGTGSHSLLIEQKNEQHPTDLAATKGLRMCMVAETPRNAKLNESRLSALTAGDRMSARGMRQDYWMFTPTAKLVMTTNHRPDLTSSEAIWRRIKSVPWPITVPMEKRDFDLARNIVAKEGKIVLDWMFQGWFAYKARGLRMPKALVQANDQYRADQDAIGQFIEEMNFTTGDVNALKITVADFNMHLDDWCRRSGMIRPTRNERTKIMEKKGFLKRKTAAGWHWFGLSHDGILAQYRKEHQ